MHLSPHGLAFVTSLVAASLGAPLVLRMLVAAKSRQTISKHIQEHAHKQGTPTMGGLIILLGTLLGLSSVWRSELTGIAVLIGGYAVLGWLDDYVLPRVRPGSRGFSWMPKLALQVGVGLLGLSMSGVTDPPSLLVGVFVILFFCNAYNFADGLDSLAGGIGLLLCLGLFAFVTVAPGQFGTDPSLSSSTKLLASALVGGFIPFMFLNAPPAKIFMGDVGSLPIGGAFGLIWFRVCQALMSAHGPAGLVPPLLLAGIMFAEIVPVPIQIFWVKAFKKRFFPFKTPIHHAFQEKGWPETRVAWTFHLVQLALVVTSVLALESLS